MAQGIGKVQIQLAVHIGAGLAHFVVKAAPNVRKIVVCAKVVVQAVAHGIKAKAVNPEFFKPVATVGKQKTPRHFLAEVK